VGKGGDMKAEGREEGRKRSELDRTGRNGNGVQDMVGKTWMGWGVKGK